MNKYLIVISLILFIGCGAEELLRQKEAPVITDLTASDDDLTVNKGDTVNFNVIAENPEEGTLSYQWTAPDGGELIGFTQSESVSWIAPFTGGSFQVKVKVSNSYKSTSASLPIIVLSEENPAVQIITPQSQAYVVQYDTIEISANAFHENGISDIHFYANDTLLLKTLPGGDRTNYDIQWFADIPAGMAEIKVIARAAQTFAEGKDSIDVFIEGILPGKK